MKIFFIVWAILLVACLTEAYFCTKFEDEL